MLWARIVSSLIGIPIILALAWVGGIPFAIAIALVAALAAWETSRLLASSAHPVRAGFVIPVAAVVAIASIGGPSFVVTALGVGMALLLVVTTLEPASSSAAPGHGAETIAAVAYASLPLAIVGLIRFWSGAPVTIGSSLAVSRGAAWIAALLTTVWCADILAYAVGRSIGRHLLLPRVSPRKTWEGSGAGIVGAAVVMLAWSGPLGLAAAAGLVLGLTVGTRSLLGDPAESQLKRSAAAKDAGRLIPGHGGILDRIDSLGFAAIVVYCAGVILGKA